MVLTGDDDGDVFQCSSTRCAGVQLGVRRRRVSCVSQHGEVLRPAHCDARRRPPNTEVCRHPDCQPVWIASPWTDVRPPELRH